MQQSSSWRTNPQPSIIHAVLRCKKPLPRAGSSVSSARLLARPSLFGDEPAKTEDDDTTTAAFSPILLLFDLHYRTPHLIFMSNSLYGSLLGLSPLQNHASVNRQTDSVIENRQKTATFVSSNHKEMKVTINFLKLKHNGYADIILRTPKVVLIWNQKIASQQNQAKELHNYFIKNSVELSEISSEAVSRNASGFSLPKSDEKHVLLFHDVLSTGNASMDSEFDL
ncbi:hypothetical protein T4D_7884 [Trichinella pseudospiralis]|uniref:Uncharacterized protein n=1 Tax=Trichinella pseudospiralis TaxID=6337 RepID=A0A0V1FRR6_TRIPS|nr:hypothetical protein T4D_7884 [Trichinella pseudospiralis]